MKKILFLQPLVPHYRISFFDKISEKYDIKILTFKKDNTLSLPKRNYIEGVSSISIGRVECSFLYKKIKEFTPSIIVTYGEVKQLSNLFLLFFRKSLNYKLIYWSHGFRNSKLNLADQIRLIELKLSDGVLFYTKKGKDTAFEKYNVRNSFHLNNTLDLVEIEKNRSDQSAETIKRKYGIHTKKLMVYLSQDLLKIKRPNY